jgi:hypothetical protein
VGRAGRTAAITVVMAVAWLPTTPARAEAPDGCGAGAGVTVVADFHGLGHPDVRSCDERGAGSTAAQLFRTAGLALTDVQRQPGFVCRVDGLPADDPCVNTPPASAYWSLWWSDATTEEWTYATVSAGSLEVPEGGSVALVWDDVAADLTPSVPPGTPAASATETAESSPTSGPAEPDDGGLPAWVGPAAIGLVLAGAGAMAVVRRRRGDSP